jgi:small subunit ribosomal protein S16
MLSIKLRRFGKKKFPTYRLVVLDKRRDTQGKYIECLGIYNPCSNPKIIEINQERVKYWLGVGAKPTITVHNLLIKKGVIEGKKIKKPITKKPIAETKPADVPKPPAV